MYVYIDMIYWYHHPVNSTDMDNNGHRWGYIYIYILVDINDMEKQRFAHRMYRLWCQEKWLSACSGQEKTDGVIYLPIEVARKWRSDKNLNGGSTFVALFFHCGFHLQFCCVFYVSKKWLFYLISVRFHPAKVFGLRLRRCFFFATRVFFFLMRKTSPCTTNLKTWMIEAIVPGIWPTSVGNPV